VDTSRSVTSLSGPFSQSVVILENLALLESSELADPGELNNELYESLIPFPLEESLRLGFLIPGCESLA